MSVCLSVCLALLELVCTLNRLIWLDIGKILKNLDGKELDGDKNSCTPLFDLHCSLDTPGPCRD